MDDASWDNPALIEAHLAADRSTLARIRRVIGTILEDPARPCALERLADDAAVSPRTLSRLFRRETGCSPAKFVERARVRLAQRLLDQSGMRIGVVAGRCGFASGEQMRRAFHRVLGTGPRGARVIPVAPRYAGTAWASAIPPASGAALPRPTPPAR